MTKQQNPQASTAFTVPELRAPQTQTGGVYQLEANSAAPTRVVRRDRLGRPVEETIPTVYYQHWVDPNGNVTQTPMRTSSVFSNDVEAVRYEQQMTIDLLRDGWLPMHACPYTPVYRNVTGTPYLVDNPERVEECGGKSDGCEHLKPIIEERRRLALERHQANEEAFMQMNPSEAGQLLRRLASSLDVVEGVAERNEKPAPPQQRRRMKDE